MEIKEIFERILNVCGNLDICTYKETGCGGCLIRKTLINAEEALNLQEQITQLRHNQWIPVEETLPDVDKYILVSFENFSVPLIGRYTVDDADGGTFRAGDKDESFIEHDLYVNAWMPLPESYKD